MALSSGWPYQQVLGYCLTIHACVSNIDINCFLIRSRLQRCGSRLRAKPLRNAFVSTASLVETLGEIKMERLGEASACISKVDVFKRDSEKCKLEGSDVFSFMFVFAETMWMTVTNSNINKLVGLWQKRRFFFLSRNGSHQRHSYSTCIFFWYAPCWIAHHFLMQLWLVLEGKLMETFQVSQPLVLPCLISPQMPFKTVSIEIPLWFH